jgi:hypothetical protein
VGLREAAIHLLYLRSLEVAWEAHGGSPPTHTATVGGSPEASVTEAMPGRQELWDACLLLGPVCDLCLALEQTDLIPSIVGSGSHRKNECQSCNDQDHVIPLLHERGHRILASLCQRGGHGRGEGLGKRWEARQ